jgi:hypothetical protein
MFDLNKQSGGKRRSYTKKAKGKHGKKKCGGSKSRSRHGGVTLGDALVPAALYAGLRYLKRRNSKKSSKKMSRKSRSK